jgi:ankyrin repeat protein
MKRSELTLELCYACESRNLIKIHALIKDDAPINAMTADGRSVLLAAIRTGQFTLVKTLLDYGADVNKPNLTAGNAPISVAIKG